jgi:hypothetical protein
MDYRIYRMKYGIAKFWRLTAGACVFVLLVPAALHVDYPNGLSVTVVTAEDLSSRLYTYQGSPAIQLPDGRMIPVITDISDPSIYNKGDGRFHPFTAALVDHALGEITHPDLHMDATIYLLPYPRRGVLVSSTTGSEMFLSPGVLDIESAVASFTIAHELGHVFHNRFMPASSSRWHDYRALRGISDESRFNDFAAHAYRPHEIFAEDFRVLFGGPDAFFGGHVENTSITEPERIAGLPAFYTRVVRAEVRQTIDATSSPNPFNPETEIRVTLPADARSPGEPVTVRVYAVTGALVRDLYDGRATGDFAVRWDGTDRGGVHVASGTYYAQIRAGGESRTLKLVMLK